MHLLVKRLGEPLVQGRLTCTHGVSLFVTPFYPKQRIACVLWMASQRPPACSRSVRRLPIQGPRSCPERLLTFLLFERFVSGQIRWWSLYGFVSRVRARPGSVSYAAAALERSQVCICPRSDPGAAPLACMMVPGAAPLRAGTPWPRCGGSCAAASLALPGSTRPSKRTRRVFIRPSGGVSPSCKGGRHRKRPAGLGPPNRSRR